MGVHAPAASGRRRHLLQGALAAAPSNQASVVDVVIRPAPDQAAGVVSSLSAPSFASSFKNQLANAGESYTVALNWKPVESSEMLVMAAMIGKSQSTARPNSSKLMGSYIGLARYQDWSCE